MRRSSSTSSASWTRSSSPASSSPPTPRPSPSPGSRDATARPDRVIGMHFMNPVPVMELVEVIRGRATSDGTFAATTELVAGIGKEMVVSRRYPGLYRQPSPDPHDQRGNLPVQRRIATAEDIDKGMRLGSASQWAPWPWLT